MITITQTKSNLKLTFDYNATYVKIIKCLPHRKYKNKTWIVPSIDLNKVIKLFDEEEILYDIVKEEKRKNIKFNLIQPKLKLFPEQEEVAQFILNNRNVINNCSIGFGKTSTSLISVISTNARKVLIVVPASLLKQWGNEIVKFTDKDFIIMNKPKFRKTYFNKEYFTLVSFSTLKNDIEKVNKINWDYVILDEIVKIKNYKSKVSKAVLSIKCKNKLALSGAILENKIEELFTIINFVKPDIFSSYWDFKRRYLITRRINYGSEIKFDELIGYKNLSNLRDIMSDFVIKKRLTDLPIKKEVTHFAKMLPAQRKYHNDIINECISELEVNSNPLAKLTLLRQVVNSPETVGLEGKSNKITVLKNILSEVGDSKVIIFTQFKKFGDIIIRELLKDKHRVTFINGSLSSGLKDELIKDWKLDGEILLATDSISYGINLQEANVLINMDLPFNPIKLQQRIGRIWRRGQKNKCLIVNIISEKSIEGRVLEILNDKIGLINNVLNEGLNKLNIETNKEMLMKILKGGK